MIIIVILLLLLVILFALKYNKKERFDKDTKEFVPLGYAKYDLTGRRLHTHPMPDCYFDQYQCYHNTTFRPHHYY